MEIKPDSSHPAKEIYNCRVSTNLPTTAKGTDSLRTRIPPLRTRGVEFSAAAADNQQSLAVRPSSPLRTANSIGSRIVVVY